MDELHVCCICGKEFVGYGHNPYPVVKEVGPRCCDDCNQIVIETRIKELTDNSEDTSDSEESE